MRRCLGPLVTLLAVLWLPAAPPAAAQGTPRYGGELIFAVPSEMPSYDGHREATVALIHPVAPHYNTLLRIDPMDRSGSRVVGDLPESWTGGNVRRTSTL